MTKLLRGLLAGVVRLRFAALTACIALFVQSGNARSYQVITADVPFEFTVGARTFAPGHYELVLAGNGLLALRDAQKHVVAALVFRAMDSGHPLPTTKLVFKKQDNHQHLTEIWVKNQVQIMEVTREEMAIRRPQPAPAPNIWIGSNSFFERNGPPGMRR